MPSSKEWWQQYQEALRRGDKAAAAEAFRYYLEAKKAEGKGGGSKPTIVRLKVGEGWHAVPVEQIPDEIEKNPEFYQSIKRVTEGK